MPVWRERWTTRVLRVLKVLQAGMMLCTSSIVLAEHSDDIDGAVGYRQYCANCHGAALLGATGPALTGDAFTRRWREKTEALRNTIANSMPLNSPGSLSQAQYREITRYIAAWGLLSDTSGHGRRSTDHRTAAAAALTTPLPAPAQVFGAASTAAPDDAQLLDSPTDWLGFNNDYEGRRYSPLKQITPDNVSTLAPRCLFQTGEVGGFQTSPIILAGRLYVTTAHSVYALDAASCRKLWSYEYQGSDAAPLPNNRGAALYRGMLFRGTLDGHLIALDASNGNLLWNVRVCDDTKGSFITGAPVVFDGKVFIGDAGADFGGTARIYAFDATSGQSIWTFDVIPSGHQPGAETWGKDSGRGGGSIWATITVEPATRRLYVSVGNPGSDLDGSDRLGDNLYTDSVVVLDAGSGVLQWYVQQNPHDVHDWDTAAAPILYDQDGHHYMAVGSKDARLYIYDRDSHQLLARKDLSRRENDHSPLTAAGVHVCPGILGGVEWNGPAYDPTAGLVLINSVDWCVTLRTKDDKIENPGMAGGFKLDPVSEAHGSLRAFDAVSGEERWVYDAGTPMLAGVTPTGSGLTLTGSTDGNLLAFDSRSGRKLYSFYTGGAIAGGISTYMVAGKQYIAVPSGNSSKSIWQSQGAATLIIFGLPP